MAPGRASQLTLVAEDLAKERAHCPFDQEELTNLIDGGKDETKARRRLEEYFLSSEVAQNLPVLESMSSVERYDFDCKQAVALYRLAKNLSDQDGSLEPLRKMMGGSIGSAIAPDGNPLGLHFVMFLPTIMGQGTSEQHAQWLGKAWNLEMIGTYAQTELGHGTFIRGLETTATYDRDTEEFVLHSPTITAYKWWPGGLGKTANHAIVMCQLVIDGEKKGPHGFLVQLRDTDTHESLPGITIGETGPKLGMNSNDNGFLGFNYHRIPRKNMLMKNAQVEADGTYMKPAAPKLNYSTMIFVRVVIVQDMVNHLKKACTIATRYSAVRRQSELRPGEPEPQIMDYQTQQWKLFPCIAMAFGFHFASLNLWHAYNDINEEVEKGQYENLPELHSLSSGLKALITQETADAVDILRKSCGGHGFMASSNMPRLWGLVTAACTYEGENTVLHLQVARYLIKMFKQHKDQPRDVAKGQLTHAAASLNASTHRKGVHPADAWNSNALELSLASEAHLRYFIIKEYATAMSSNPASPPVRSILRNFFDLLAMNWILRFSGNFMRFANVKANHMTAVQERITLLLSEIRPNAVNIVDSFDIPDQSLGSCLGAYDGNVYERMLEHAKSGPLNKTDVPATFERHLKPLMKSSL